MIKSNQLKDARRLIANRFITQCLHGPQTKDLGDSATACGQFLDEKTSVQRGIHGTAAAIRVLGEDGRPDAQRLLSKLIHYLNHRSQFEESKTELYLAQDRANVIKIGELLFALSFVKKAVCDCGQLITELASQLQQGMTTEQGWGYFTDDEESEPQLLPTAHAVRGLAAHGFSVDGPVEYLLGALSMSSSSNGARADISVRVFCLYVLSFYRDLDKGEQRERRKLLTPMWRRLERLLDDDIEQNVEYSRGDKHFYVRVPWQLYLLALASRLAPNRRFASRSAQSRLESIIQSVNSTAGFLYPHSGLRISSRTNAILYDVFSTSEKQLEHEILLTPAYMIDRVRSAVSSTVFRSVVSLIAILIISKSIYAWYEKGGGSISDLAPNFLASVCILLLSIGKSK